MEQLRGMAVVNEMKIQLQREVLALERPPVLAIVRVGERPDDLSYERGAKKRMAGIGIETVSCVFDAGISHEEFLPAFLSINSDPDIDGILLLRPLPKQIDEGEIVRRMDPAKDVDGITPASMAKVFMGDEDGFAPCTAEAVVEMLKYTGMPLAGKRAIVAGRSLVVGKPLAMLLLKENCTVTICHSRTSNLREICRQADILVTAIGKPEFFDGSFVAPGATVLDVGIHQKEDGTMCGDVAFHTLDERTGYATPVPGGVGTVTTSVLAKHVIRAAKNRRQKAV